jgi:hypothetical protein
VQRQVKEQQSTGMRTYREGGGGARGEKKKRGREEET